MARDEREPVGHPRADRSRTRLACEEAAKVALLRTHVVRREQREAEGAASELVKVLVELGPGDRSQIEPTHRVDVERPTDLFAASRSAGAVRATAMCSRMKASISAALNPDQTS